MEIRIVKAGFEYHHRCSEILKGSELGMRYFINSKGEYIGKQLLQEGFENNEMYVAISDSGECIGFSWIQTRGIFHWFPFLHVVVVDEKRRSEGIGSKLMQHFEQISFVEEKSPKAFLMVGDYNNGAYDLYKRLGYAEVGKVPGLFIKEVSEILMMKESE